MTNKTIDIEAIEEAQSKKKSTKITASIILGIVFVLAMFILVSSFANVELNPNFVARPDVIRIYKSGHTVASGTITSAEEDEERYNDFMEYYDNMFTSSFLSALFNGRLSGYAISEAKSVKSTSNLISQFDNGYVQFSYDEEIALTYKNGKECKYKNNTAETITFKDLYFEISEDDALKTITFYVVDYNSTQREGNTYYYEVSLAANTSDLFENIEDFYNSIRA